jgi:hypothetical protein
MNKPEPSSRHPLIIFFLLLTFVSGVSIELRLTDAPMSIVASLPIWGVALWGWALILGSTSLLIGLVLQGYDARLVSGVLFEQVGAATLGCAAIVYSAALMAVAGWSGVYPAGVTFGFGVACIYRWVSLQRGIARARPAKAKGERGDGRG